MGHYVGLVVPQVHRKVFPIFDFCFPRPARRVLRARIARQHAPRRGHPAAQGGGAGKASRSQHVGFGRALAPPRHPGARQVGYERHGNLLPARVEVADATPLRFARASEGLPYFAVRPSPCWEADDCTSRCCSCAMREASPRGAPPSLASTAETEWSTVLGETCTVAPWCARLVPARGSGTGPPSGAGGEWRLHGRHALRAPPGGAAPPARRLRRARRAPPGAAAASLSALPEPALLRESRWRRDRRAVH